jgi:hypothetical protein
VRLAEKRFDVLSECETTLLSAIMRGETGDCAGAGHESDWKQPGRSWEKERLVRGELFAWLCSDVEAQQYFSRRGVSLAGAKVVGAIDLTFERCGFPIRIFNSVLTDAMILRQAHLAALNLATSATRSIILNGAEVGVLFLRGLNIDGDVRLIGSNIDGSLDLTASTLTNGGQDVIVADGARVNGSMVLAAGFTAHGGLRMRTLEVGGDFDATGGRFLNVKGDALDLHRADIGGTLLLRSEIEGRVDLSFARIARAFTLQNDRKAAVMKLDLSEARVGILNDSRASWPPKGGLSLGGFEYATFADEAPRDAVARLHWIALQSRSDNPQPYQHLAAVMRKSGYYSDARKVLLAKEREAARQEGFWWYWLGSIIGYGYEPTRAVWLGILVIGCGWAVFKYAFRNEIMVWDESTGGPRLVYPLMYSIALFVPLVSFRIERSWMPDPDRGRIVTIWGVKGPHFGVVILLWFWFEIAVGWVLSTLLAIALARLLYDGGAFGT